MQVGDDSFVVNLYSIPLDGFDVVLGIKWLRTLGPILWDFSSLTISFQWEGRMVQWKGQLPNSEQQVALLQWQQSAYGALEKLLAEFSYLFEEPSELPPKINCDHRIPLLPDSGLVGVRPYRYPHLLEDEIEKKCEEMLQQEIIRPSTSIFSSPVLLVKKQDGTWRFYVDYRELNAHTVKDKFPILVVDELLYELHGANYFTKLDLISGYYQIRMDHIDVEKMTFRTHHGHFEFLVMSFGLSNAPSTFQSLMNDVFRPHLRKFGLVFFDDILIYSKTSIEHIQHRHMVFQLLRDHHLFLKRSKCSFRET